MDVGGNRCATGRALARRRSRLLAGLLAIVLAPAALAGPPGRPVQVALGAGTDFPLSAGVRLELEAGSRLRLSTSLGVVPGAYVDVVNRAIVSAGGYDETTGGVVKRSLERAIVWRTHAGARVWRGSYLEAGYGLAALGGAATAGDVLAAVTGRTLPPGADRPFEVASTLHLLDVEAGWVFDLGRGFRLRAALGAGFTLGASTRITARDVPAPAPLVEAFARDAEAYLDETYRTYVHVPVVGVSLSRTIF